MKSAHDSRAWQAGQECAAAIMEAASESVHGSDDAYFDAMKRAFRAIGTFEAAADCERA